MSAFTAPLPGRPLGETLRRWLPAGVSAAGALGVALYMALRGYQIDIDIYRMGGRHALLPDLYSVRFGGSGLPFTYTPFAALMFALPALNLAVSSLQRIWAVTNIIALASSIYLSIRVAAPQLAKRSVLRWSLLLMLPALFLDPVFVNIGLGQINLALCVLIMWDLLSDRKVGSKTMPPGVATGIAAAIKLTPLIFVPYLLLIRKGRGAMNSLATFAVCSAAAFAISPKSSVTYWTKDVFDSKRAGTLLYSSDQNLSSFLQRLHHGPVPAELLLSLMAVIGVVGVLLAAWAHRRSSALLGVLVCATTGLIISPITWVHHLVWIVPAIIWMTLAQDRPKYGRWIAGATTVLFLAAPIWWVPSSWSPLAHVPELHQNRWQLIAGNSFFFAMVAALVGVTGLLWMRTRSAQLSAQLSGQLSPCHLNELDDGLPVPGRRAD